MYRVQDSSGGNYSGGIVFDCLNISQYLVRYSDAQIAIPLSIASAGFTGNGQDAISFRGSTFSLLQGLFVQEKISGNQLISMGNQLYHWNNVRILFEKTQNWLESEGTQYLVQVPSAQYNGSDILPLNVGSTNFGLDCSVYSSINAGQYYLSSNGGSFTGVDIEAAKLSSGGAANNGLIAQSTTYGRSNFNQNYNSAFDQSVRDFYKAFKWNSSTSAYEGIVYFQLKELHPFFEEVCDVPMKNVRFYIVLNCACSQLSSAFPSLVVPVSNTSPVTMKIGNSKASTCTLYAMGLTLAPSANAKYAEALKKGITYTKIYREVQPIIQVTNVAQTSVNVQVTNSVTSPCKLYCLLPPTGWTASQNVVAGGSQASSYNGFPCAPSVGSITSANVQVNSQNYLQQNLVNGGEMWLDQIQPSMCWSPSTGGSEALITWPAFNSYLQMPVFDVSRPRNLQLDTKLPVTMTTQLAFSTNNGVTTVDFIGLLTYYRTAHIHFTDTQIEISYTEGAKYAA